jgi:S-(hydroxymethyl)mycothiol dehydrogenase
VRDLFSHGGSPKSFWYCDCLPERDTPTLASLCLRDRLTLDQFVTECIGIDDIDPAFQKMQGGEAVRWVVMP